MSADISFASFNLYNFQKAGLTTYRGKIISDAEYNAKKAWTREMLRKVNADVVILQELWHPDCLNDVLDIAEFAEYKAVYIAPSWTNIAVALIVRSPWELSGNVEVIKKFPFTELFKIDDNDGEDDEMSISISRFSRSVLKVKLKHESSNSTPQITLFACHLKSKLPAIARQMEPAYRVCVGSAISTIRRTAEATALRMMLIDHMEGSNSPTVVIGDFNDDPLSNTLGIITDQPTITKRSRGGDKKLYNTVHFEQLQSFNNVFYTHEHNNHKNVLDQILVSEEFFEYSNRAKWSHKHTQIWNDHIEDDDPFTSDHGIIKSSFK